MPLPRSMMIAVAAGALSLALLSLFGPATAQGYPNRQITMIVPFAVGGPVDNVGRAFADAMRRNLGQVIVVDNRPGAGGIVGSKAVASAKPDGYMLLIGSPGPLIVAPAAGAAGVDIDKQLTAIGLIGDSPQILAAGPGSKSETLAQLVDHIKSNKGALNYGSAGIGTMPHLAAELFKSQAGLDITHIPYRGTGAALPDLLSGRTVMLFGDITAILPQLEAGRLKGLGITATRRSELAPAVPTTAEAGMPNLLTRNWNALMGPAGLPADVVNRLSEGMRAIGADTVYRDIMRKQGAVIAESSPVHVQAHIRAERATLEPLVRSIGLKLE